MSELASKSIRIGQPSLKVIALFVLKLAVASLFLVAMYKYGLLDFRQITTRPLTLHFLLVLGAGCAFALGALAILAWRLILLLSVQGISIPYGRAFMVTVTCNLASAVLPGIVAGDIIKAAYLFRLAPDGRSGVAATVLFDRLLGLYGLLILGSLSAGYAVITDLPIRREILLLAAAGTFFATVGLVGLVEISHRGRISTEQTKGFYFVLSRLASAVAAYRTQPRTLLCALVLSVASHALTVGTFVCSGIAIHDALALPMHFVLDPLAMMLNAVPISPGGLGLAEGAFAVLFAGAGSPNGALIGLMGRLLLYAVSTPVALIGFLGRHESTPVEKE